MDPFSKRMTPCSNECPCRLEQTPSSPIVSLSAPKKAWRKASPTHPTLTIAQALIKALGTWTSTNKRMVRATHWPAPSASQFQLAPTTQWRWSSPTRTALKQEAIWSMISVGSCMTFPIWRRRAFWCTWTPWIQDLVAMARQSYIKIYVRPSSIGCSFTLLFLITLLRLYYINSNYFVFNLAIPYDSVEESLL